MKEHWSINKEKLVSLEEGLSQNGDASSVKPLGTSGRCSSLIQCVKLILYVQLAFFIGFACYSMWQTYRIRSMEVKVTDIIREPEVQSLFDEKSMEQMSIAPSKESYVFEDTLMKVQKANAHFQETLRDDQEIPSNNEADIGFTSTQNPDSETDWTRDTILSTNSDNESIQQSFESSTVSTAGSEDVIEDTLDESSETKLNEEDFQVPKSKEDVLEWSIPFHWSIHGIEHERETDVKGYETLAQMGDRRSEELERSQLKEESTTIEKEHNFSQSESTRRDEISEMSKLSSLYNSELLGRTWSWDGDSVEDYQLRKVEGTTDVREQVGDFNPEKCTRVLHGLVVVVPCDLSSQFSQSETMQESSEIDSEKLFDQYYDYDTPVEDDRWDETFVLITESSTKEIDGELQGSEEKSIYSENPPTDEVAVYQSVNEDSDEPKPEETSADFNEQEHDSTESIKSDFDMRNPSKEGDSDDQTQITEIAVDSIAQEEENESVNPEVSHVLISDINLGFAKWDSDETPVRTEIEEASEAKDMLASEENLSTLIQDAVLTEMLHEDIPDDLDNYFNGWTDRMYAICTIYEEYLQENSGRPNNEMDFPYPSYMLHCRKQFLSDRVDNTHRLIRSINNGANGEGKVLNKLAEYTKPASLLREAIHEKEALLTQKIAKVDGVEHEVVEKNLNKFFHEMEILAAHIDKLHERYLRLNELNDDYVSKEIPESFER